MTEAKRVTLTTISNSVTSSLLTTGSSGTLRFGADLLSQTDKPTTESCPAGGKGSNKTIRLNIELFETDSVKYPEFNYAKLLHVEKVSKCVARLPIKFLNKKQKYNLSGLQQHQN